MDKVKIDLTGKRFERWTVLGYSHHVRTQAYWNARCDCGIERKVNGPEMVRGNSKSCGCLMREKASERSGTHRLSKHPAFQSWVSAKSRCRNPNDTGYCLYGAKGVTFSPDWDRFDDFWRDMGPNWFAGASIDRIDGAKGYAPGNCRWATPKQQANNRVTNHMIGNLTVTQFAEKHGLRPGSVFARIRYGWPEDRLGEPARKKRNSL